MSLSGTHLLITGGTGFIGQHLTQQAIARGFTVRTLQRDASKATVPEGIEAISGDITHPADAARACTDIDVVIHTAALARENGPEDLYWPMNVEGTVTLGTAAKQAGVKTFVNLSTVMVYGFDFPDGITEAGPFYSGDRGYPKSKLEAERRILALNEPTQFGVINIRPGDVYGPGPSEWVLRTLDLIRQRKVTLVGGGYGVFNHVYIDNLIDAIFLAIERRSYGESFNITDGCRTTWREYFPKIADIGRFPRPFAVPYWFAKIATRLINDPAMTMDTLAMIMRTQTYSIEKAKQVLGYQPQVSLDEGLARTQRWLKEHGHIPQ